MNDPETFYHRQLLKKLPVSWNQHGSSNEIKYQAVQSLPGPMPMKTVSLPKLPPSLPVKAQMTRLRLKHYFCWANGMCFCIFFCLLISPFSSCHATTATKPINSTHTAHHDYSCPPLPRHLGPEFAWALEYVFSCFLFVHPCHLL